LENSTWAKTIKASAFSSTTHCNAAGSSSSDCAGAGTRTMLRIAAAALVSFELEPRSLEQSFDMLHRESDIRVGRIPEQDDSGHAGDQLAQ